MMTGIRLRHWVVLAAAVVVVSAAAAVGGADRFQVKWVADGDTVLLKDGRWIRYLGINTPEVATKDHRGEPLGSAARRRNRSLIDNLPVKLEFDRARKDRYGRTLAYVTNSRGQMINELLVTEGLAYCLWLTPNDRYTESLLKAQRQAIATRRGLWALLRSHTGPVAANRRSRRFHHPDCPMAKKISAKNRQSFPSIEAAFHAGYAPAKACLPATALFHENK